MQAAAASAPASLSMCCAQHPALKTSLRAPPPPNTLLATTEPQLHPLPQSSSPWEEAGSPEVAKGLHSVGDRASLPVGCHKGCRHGSSHNHRRRLPRESLALEQRGSCWRVRQPNQPPGLARQSDTCLKWQWHRNIDRAIRQTWFHWPCCVTHPSQQHPMHSVVRDQPSLVCTHL